MSADIIPAHLCACAFMRVRRSKAECHTIGACDYGIMSTISRLVHEFLICGRDIRNSP